MKCVLLGLGFVPNKHFCENACKGISQKPQSATTMHCLQSSKSVHLCIACQVVKTKHFVDRNDARKVQRNKKGIPLLQ